MGGTLLLLRLQQILDSQFPIGAFAHSWGLEAYAQGGNLSQRALYDLLYASLTQGSVGLEGAACALAHSRAGRPKELLELAHQLAAWTPIAGPRETSLRLGGRLLRILSRLYGLAWPSSVPPHQSLVTGWALARLGLPLSLALPLYLQSSLMALLAAAIRSMALSPEAAQEILTQLQPHIATKAMAILKDPDGHFHTATPGWDFWAAVQPHLETRLFLS
ncbi:hypothetical protein KZX47_04855 [Thermus sp. SYSU G05001]|uniref:Urease accessory protein UreF n=1 Tax=Thermus brevis TaxID=2862456 RepID=A0ABS6ZXD4_9DEIN|nr:MULTISPECIES: urease accessory UreF family protein [Thermus]MBW6394485.1 hypothetical protein [Thermus brevis]